MVVRFWIIIVPLQSRQEKDVFQWTQRQIKRFPLLRCRKDGLHPAVHIQGVEREKEYVVGNHLQD